MAWTVRKMRLFAKGNGNVENKVGYLRRNELVPVPESPSLSKKNRLLLNCYDQDIHRKHYDDHTRKTIQKLFETDREALLPLPCVPFDTALYTSAVADKYGKFTLDNGKHRYSGIPHHRHFVK